MTIENKIYITASELAEMHGSFCGTCLQNHQKIKSGIRKEWFPGDCRKSSQTIF